MLASTCGNVKYNQLKSMNLRTLKMPPLEMNPPPLSPIVQVAIGILVRGQGQSRQVFIARRHASAVLGGLWEFPGGKVEANETPRQAAAREFLEEVGLVVEVGEALATITHGYEHATVMLHPYICAMSGQGSQEARNLAVAEHRWVDAASLNEFDFPAANAELVKRIMATLTAT